MLRLWHTMVGWVVAWCTVVFPSYTESHGCFGLAGSISHGTAAVCDALKLNTAGGAICQAAGHGETCSPNCSAGYRYNGPNVTCQSGVWMPDNISCTGIMDSVSAVKKAIPAPFQTLTLATRIHALAMPVAVTSQRLQIPRMAGSVPATGTMWRITGA